MDVTTGPSHSQPSAGAGSQIRSRVTVVCAECKRLKLKCDRRTPCSSCLKRDTVPRCTYSAAAAEKIDVQSLHNRVLVIESQLSQLSSGGSKVASHDIDHALLAVGASGSSVLVPLDDVAGVWLEHLDLGRDSGIDLQPAFPITSSDSEGQHKDYSRPESSPHSHGGSAHSSPHPASISTSVSTSAPLQFCPFSHASSTTVTPALLALLPSAQQRPALLDVLSSVLRMHPSLNFPHFRARINAMFSDGSSPEEIGIGPPRADHAEKPTLSLFAAAAAGFALALQCSPTAGASSSPRSPPAMALSSTHTVSSLLALSSHALDFAEDNVPYDLDFLHALVLRCLCMLHDGMPRISQAVFANVGKMVNVARMMGLAKDPDEFSGVSNHRYTLWEAEMRRRMWWDVFYYDLFISDCMGQAPLISDDQHTCRMPADVDEDSFVPNSVVLPQPADHPAASNFSYFVQKCKLAQLVKSMKKRPSSDSPSPPNAGTQTPSEPSMDVANQAESEVQQYLSDLPPAFKLDVDADPDTSSTSPSPRPSLSLIDRPHLIVQRCELVALANQLVLKVFHPFLRRPNVRPPHNALLSCINAAHAIIQASRIARGVWQKHGSSAAQMNNTVEQAGTGIIPPSSHGVFYPFARQLFDASIIAAHVLIHAPQAVFAKVVLEDLRIALEVLRDPAIATGRGRASSRGGVEGCPSEAVSIVELMVKKAEQVKRNNAPVSAGTKRKHEEVEASVGNGFWLPYVGTGVATESGGSGLHGSPGASGLTNGLVHGSSPRAKLSEKPFAPENQPHHHAPPHRLPSATREKDKERKYPVVGIRNRLSVVASADHKSPGGMPRGRPEASVSRLPQQPSGDPAGYRRRATSTSTPTPSMQPEPAQGATGEFSLSTPYRVEDAHMVDMSASPTSSRFPPNPPNPQPHSYSSHSFQPSGVSAQHQPMYNSSPYAADSSPQPQPQPQPQSHQPFYAPYHSSGPPSHPTYPPMNSQGHTHTHQHIQQQQHHPQMNMTPLMGLLPNQNVMDASDIPLVAKQEECTDMQDSRSHQTDSPYASNEGWVDAGTNTRFAAQTSWDPGSYSF